MKIEKINNGSELTFKLEGRLDTTTAPQFEEEIKNSLAGVTKIVMDFEKLEYISSAGLRVLLSTQKKMKDQGTMIIRNVNEIVKDVFDMTGFLDILTIE